MWNMFEEQLASRTLLDIDRAIELLQRAKESGATYITCQFNRDSMGLDGLYVGSWHSANYPGRYTFCFAYVDPAEWIPCHEDGTAIDERPIP